MEILILINALILCVVVHYFAYKRGYSDGYRGRPAEVVPVPTRGKMPKETAEEMQARTLADNLEAFDGSGRGQSKL